jgi:hypothetical protein
MLNFLIGLGVGFVMTNYKLWAVVITWFKGLIAKTPATPAK